ncbi:MAG: tetratricopeptide repeat protein, partial [Bacteroidetes bacterium]
MGCAFLQKPKARIITSCSACAQYSSKPGKSGTMKKATLLSSGLLLLVLPLFSQEQKGVTPLGSGVKTRTDTTRSDVVRPGVTRAVVIGISDYQDPRIPDLKYADRDADEFARFLHDKAGGNLPAENIRVLQNEHATIGQVSAAFGWLVDETQPGDSVIVYFSGHGDMNAPLIDQSGFLLLWDSRASVYLGGALRVSDFQAVIATLAVNKRASVCVIADACRAGKMYSSNLARQLTTAELALQQANETKILSCQPDEFSIEGAQWGDGRGVFSYHLINGLIGLADANRDRAVSLPEIERYLAEHVSSDVKPLSQTPLMRGDSNTIIAHVDQAILDSLDQNHDFTLPQFKPVEQRGLEQEILAHADSSVLQIYAAYQQAIGDKRLLEPVGDCAEYYFSKLLQIKLIEPLCPALRRNYAAALIDDAQQVINRLIKSSPDEYERSSGYITAHYSNYPAQIERATELLGPEHFMHATLTATRYWFEGVLARREIKCLCPNKETGDTVLALHRKALALQPAMSTAYLEMLCAQGYQLLNLDSAAYYAEKALEQVPGWELVYAWMANLYIRNNQMADAKKWLDRGLAADSASIPILTELSRWYARQGLEAEEEQTLGKILDTDTLS